MVKPYVFVRFYKLVLAIEDTIFQSTANLYVILPSTTKIAIRCHPLPLLFCRRSAVAAGCAREVADGSSNFPRLDFYQRLAAQRRWLRRAQGENAHWAWDLMAICMMFYVKKTHHIHHELHPECFFWCEHVV